MVFISNDNHRKLKSDFDVRAHAALNEERNLWIIEKTKHKDQYTLRSKTNPTFYLFAANDGSNKYNNDYDVRTHAVKVLKINIVE